MKRRTLTLCVQALMLLIASPAMAQESPCKPADQMDAYLLKKYGEVQAEQGITDDPGYMLILYLSPEGKTFSIAMVRGSDKVACLKSAGTDWQERKPEQGGGL